MPVTEGARPMTIFTFKKRRGFTTIEGNSRRDQMNNDTFNGTIFPAFLRPTRGLSNASVIDRARARSSSPNPADALLTSTSRGENLAPSDPCTDEADGVRSHHCEGRRDERRQKTNRYICTYT